MYLASNGARHKALRTRLMQTHTEKRTLILYCYQTGDKFPHLWIVLTGKTAASAFQMNWQDFQLSLVSQPYESPASGLLLPPMCR